jgi:hypothetical protein
MESGKIASIFSDRSAIGSADELDEYGVWVKSEPEDIAFDDSAFPGETGKASEITDIESDLDFDLSGAGTGETALTSGDLDISDDSGFDVDFGNDTEAGDASAEAFVEDISADDSGFDVDFGSDVEAGDASTSEVLADDSSFDVDFTDEAEAGDASAEPPASEILADDSGFDVDFTDEAEAGETPAEPSASEILADDSGFDVDFTDEAEAGETSAEPSASEVLADDSGFDVDFTDEAEAGDASAEPSASEILVDDSGFDVDFTDETEAGETHAEPSASEILTDDSGFDVDMGDNAAADEYDFEIRLDDIPNTPQTAGIETTAPETAGAVPSQDGVLANELLLKIVGELSTIKAELNSLKEEISTIRDNALGDKPVSPEVKAAPDGFSAETLSAAELEAVLTNSEIESVETVVADDMTVDDEFVPIGSINIEVEEESPPAVELELPQDVDGIEAEDEAPPVVELDLPADVAGIEAENEAPPAAELDLPADVAGIEAENEAPPAAEADMPAESDEIETGEAETSADIEPPLDDISVDLDLTETPDEDSSAGAAIDDLDDFDIPGEAPPVEDIVVPALNGEEAAALPDFVPEKPDYLSPDDLVDINEYRAAETTASAADVPAEADEAAIPQDGHEMAISSHDPLDTLGFKRDLQIVLSYMDKLLEALPDEKIEEFARSEQFDTYKKVFKELGLV